MKRITTLMIALLVSINIFATDKHLRKLMELEGNDTIPLTEADTANFDAEVLKTSEKLIKDDTLKIDTTTIRFGKRKVVIIEKDGTTEIEIPDTKESYFIDKENEEYKYEKKPSFDGHWAGFEWGFNGFMDPEFSIVMEDDLRFLELNQPRSWNLNLNILEYSLGFGTDKIGLVTGLGFEFSSYHFRNLNTIKIDGGIAVVDSSYILDPNKNVTKSKLSTTHITLPLLVELQIPVGKDRHRIFFSAGAIGGARIGSSTKVIYEGTNEGKDKIKGDFNLSSFRYGLTARIGYRGLRVFANYYPTPLFEKNKGPEVYPFSIGLILLDF